MTDVSVVITTRNRVDKLARTLKSLEQQQTNGLRWEVVVIDNGSCDATSDLLTRAEDKLPLVSRRFDPPGKCKAQNYAIENVHGTLVVFTDDDVRFCPGWLEALWRAAQDWPHAKLFGGAIRVRLMGDTPVWLSGEKGRAIVKRHCAHYWPRDDEGYTDISPIGPNMAVRGDVLAEFRFDENLGPNGTQDYIKSGDTDFNQRLMSSGHRCVFVPHAVVEHHAYPEQLAMAALLRGAYRRGRKNAYMYPETKRHPRIAGVPLSLWFKAAKQGLRYKLALLRPAVRRYELGVKFHYRLGYIRQLKTGISQSRRTG